LFDGAIAEAFVVTEKIAGVSGIGGCELVCHGTILCRHEAAVQRVEQGWRNF
jgi:hypothetical protein